MDARLIQALRLLMDVTLSELVPVEEKTGSEPSPDNPRFDDARFQRLKEAPKTPPRAKRESNGTAELPDTAKTAPGYASAEVTTTAPPDGPEAEAFRRALLAGTTEAYADVPAPYAPETPDLPSVGGMDALSPEPFSARYTAAYPAIPAQPGVNGRLTMQDISDHFEQDARRY